MKIIAVQHNAVPQTIVYKGEVSNGKIYIFEF